MRRGLGVYAWTNLIRSGGMDALDFVRDAAARGAGVVQFADVLPLEDAPLLADVERAAADGGVALEVGVRGLDGERLARAASLAHRHGSSFVRLVIDSPGDEPSFAEAEDRLGDLARRIAPVRIGVENHDRFPAAILARIVRNVGAVVVLDTANSLGSLEGTETVVRELGPLAVSLHVKDVVARRVPSQLGFLIEGAAAGTGGVDWDLVRSHLTPLCGSAILESWAPDVTAEKAMTEAGWAWLSQWTP